MYLGLHVQYRSVLQDFNVTWIFSTEFRKMIKYQISWNPSSGRRVVPCGQTDIKYQISLIRPVGDELFRVDRRTDRHQILNFMNPSSGRRVVPCGRTDIKYQISLIRPVGDELFRVDRHQISNFMKSVQWETSCSMWTDGHQISNFMTSVQWDIRTDGQTWRNSQSFSAILRTRLKIKLSI